MSPAEAAEPVAQCLPVDTELVPLLHVAATWPCFWLCQLRAVLRIYGTSFCGSVLLRPEDTQLLLRRLAATHRAVYFSVLEPTVRLHVQCRTCFFFRCFELILWRKFPEDTFLHLIVGLCILLRVYPPIL
jgi:hypothetical protein